MTEDGSPVHGVPVHGVATMEDGCPVDSVAMMDDGSQVDEVSQSSSISITARPSGLPENQVGRKGEIQARKLHTITTVKYCSPVDGAAEMEDGGPVDGLSLSSPISITTRPSIMLAEILVGREVKVRNLYNIATMQDGSPVDGAASQSSSIIITTRPSITPEENLVGRGGEPRRVGQVGPLPMGLAIA
jgi:hypothetical protein